MITTIEFVSNSSAYASQLSYALPVTTIGHCIRLPLRHENSLTSRMHRIKSEVPLGSWVLIIHSIYRMTWYMMCWSGVYPGMVGLGLRWYDEDEFTQTPGIKLMRHMYSCNQIPEH
jgi:hypothetical protein